jgi:hypothetical protein
MDIFLEKHRESILGVVEGFDRIIFKGYLTSMFPDGAFGRYLYKRGVLLKDAGKFFESETEVPTSPASMPSASGGSRRACKGSARLSQVVAQEQVILKPGITLPALQAQARSPIDLAAVQAMQCAKRELFAGFVKPQRGD